MKAKLLIAVVIFLITLMVASSVASITPLLVPSIASPFYCPRDQKISIASYSTFPMDQERNGIFFTCLSEGGKASSNPNAYLQGYGKSIGFAFWILLFPATLLYAKLISRPKHTHTRSNRIIMKYGHRPV